MQQEQDMQHEMRNQMPYYYDQYYPKDQDLTTEASLAAEEKPSIGSICPKIDIICC